MREIKTQTHIFSRAVSVSVFLIRTSCINLILVWYLEIVLCSAKRNSLMSQRFQSKFDLCSVISVISICFLGPGMNRLMSQNQLAGTTCHSDWDCDYIGCPHKAGVFRQCVNGQCVCKYPWNLSVHQINVVGHDMTLTVPCLTICKS